MLLKEKIKLFFIKNKRFAIDDNEFFQGNSQHPLKHEYYKTSITLIGLMKKFIAKDYKLSFAINVDGKLSLLERTSDVDEDGENLNYFLKTIPNFHLLVYSSILFFGEKANLNFLDTEHIINMSRLFSQNRAYLKLKNGSYDKLSSFTNIHSSFGLEKKNGKEFIYIYPYNFQGCIDEWTFISVTDASYFLANSKFNTHRIDFDFKQSVNCDFMFCDSFYDKKINISHPCIVSASYMFYGVKNKQPIYLDLSSCENIAHMFDNNKSVIQQNGIDFSQISEIDFKVVIDRINNQMNQDTKKYNKKFQPISYSFRIKNFIDLQHPSIRDYSNVKKYSNLTDAIKAIHPDLLFPSFGEKDGVFNDLDFYNEFEIFLYLSFLTEEQRLSIISNLIDFTKRIHANFNENKIDKNLYSSCINKALSIEEYFLNKKEKSVFQEELKEILTEQGNDVKLDLAKPAQNTRKIVI